MRAKKIMGCEKFYALKTFEPRASLGRVRLEGSRGLASMAQRVMD